MANGDFSSVAGTYQNDLGDTITVSPSGSVTVLVLKVVIVIQVVSSLMVLLKMAVM
ncbi:MAG: DUF6287 domain-containing protein [Streptococcus salivarius]